MGIVVELLVSILGPIGFVASAGLLFQKRFHENYLLIALAALIAIGSTWLTVEEYWKRFASTHPPVVDIPPIVPPVLAPDEVFWLAIRDTAAQGLFEEFIRKFPASPHVAEAQQRIRSLASVQPRPTPHDLGGPTNTGGPTRTGTFCVNVNSRQICD